MNNQNNIPEQVHKADKSQIGGPLFYDKKNSGDVNESLKCKNEVNSTTSLKDKAFRVLWRNIFKM